MCLLQLFYVLSLIVFRLRPMPKAYVKASTYSPWIYFVSSHYYAYLCLRDSENLWDRICIMLHYCARFQHVTVLRGLNLWHHGLWNKNSYGVLCFKSSITHLLKVWSCHLVFPVQLAFRLCICECQFGLNFAQCYINSLTPKAFTILWKTWMAGSLQ